jgi:hypothetical protein
LAEKQGGAAGCLVVVLIAGVWGWSTYSDHQAKVKAAEKQARSAELAKKEEEAAISLAKHARTLAGDWPATKTNAELVTNDYRLKQILSHMSGDLQIIGWQAKKFDETTYVVSYMYQRAGVARGWPFEVNVKAGVVRRIVGDPELEKKYGWAQSDDAEPPN